MCFSILRISLCGLLCFIYCGLVNGQEVVTQTDDQNKFRQGETHLTPVKLPSITPTEFNGDKTAIKLPGPFDHVVVGGNGRYLIFYLKQLRQLAIFDVSAAKIIKQLPIESNDITIAASADKIVAVLRDESLIQRYSLVTFQKEVSRILPRDRKIQQISMGSASNGPVFVMGQKGGREDYALFDLNSLKLSKVNRSNNRSWYIDQDFIVQASANGQVFGFCRPNSFSSGLTNVVIKKKSVESYYRRASKGVVVPNSDGSLFYTSDGIYNHLLKKISDDNSLDHGIPAVYSDFHFVRGSDGVSFDIHLAGHARALASVSAPGPRLLPQPKNQKRRPAGSGVIKTERFLRNYYIPEAQVLIYLPQSNAEIMLQRFDLMQTLEKSDRNYLFISGTPVKEAILGKSYAYPIQVKSKQKKVKFSLANGPPGMTVSTEGIVQWQVPANFVTRQTSVIVHVRDGSGYELFHDYQLSLQDQRVAVAASQKLATPLVAIKPSSREQNKTSTKQEPLERTKRSRIQIQLPKILSDVVAGASSRYRKMYDKNLEKRVTSGASKKRPNTAKASLAPTNETNQKQKTIKLPAQLTDMVSANNGRYLIMYFKSLKKLEVFDTSKLAFIKSIPVESDDILFAAGAEYLIVVLRDQNKMERWKLSDFTRNLVVPVPVDDPVNAIVMGHASLNSLVLFTRRHRFAQKYTYVNPRTMRVIELDEKNKGYFNSNPVLLKAAASSADGRIVTLGDSFLIFKESTVEHRKCPRDFAYGILPSADGTFLYSGRGIITNQMEIIYQPSKVGRPVPAIQLGSPIPAVQAGFFLNLLSPNHLNPNQSHRIAVHAAGQVRPLLVLDNIDTSLCKPIREKTPGMAFAKRYSFFPNTNILIQIPNTNDRLIIHQTNVEELLKQSGTDYFYVTSHPETTAEPGQNWKYQLKVNSKRGGVQYRLETGPEGMTITDTGLVAWKVPSDIEKSEVGVTIQLKDFSTQEASHRFTLIIPAAIQIAKEKAKRELEQKAAEEKMAVAKKVAEREAAKAAALAERNRLKLKRLNENGEAARDAAEKYAAQRLQRFDRLQVLRRLNSIRNPFRIWTDTSENEIEARLIQYFADTAIVYTKNNQIRTVPVSSLSAVDREYLNQISKAEIAERKQRETEAANTSLPHQRLRQILVAIQEYTSRYGRSRLPKNIKDQSGKSLLSWRVQILDRTGEEDLYHLFRHDEPWDSEYNKKLIPLMPAFYRSPESKARPGKTNLLAIQRQGSLFTGLNGAIQNQGGDLSQKSAVIVEVPDELAVEWTKPSDWEYQTEKSIELLFGFHPEGFYTLFANGKTQIISRKNSLKKISEILNLEGNQPAASK